MLPPYRLVSAKPRSSARIMITFGLVTAAVPGEVPAPAVPRWPAAVTRPRTPIVAVVRRLIENSSFVRGRRRTRVAVRGGGI
jgi:hypothetical protein